jgi:low affinity Fe/Cu permease
MRDRESTESRSCFVRNARQPLAVRELGTSAQRQTLWTMNHIRHWLTLIGVSTSHPLAFAIVGLYVVAWLAFDPGSLNWQGLATVATWIMTLFIQRAENRDTQAIHAKLDELLRVEGQARNELTVMDQKEPEEIALHRTQEREIAYPQR